MKRIITHTMVSKVFLRWLSILLLTLVAPVEAYSSCTSPANAIEAENCLPGTDDSIWDIQTNDAGDPTIQGFATDISLNQGGTVKFKVKTPASAWHLDIYRMGYYQGFGARKIATVNPSVPLPQNQPACLTDSSTNLTDCGNWSVSASWTVPANATSGIYFAKAIRNDTGGASHIVFIVRNDSSHSDILFQASDTTWQAYNDYSPHLYGCGTGFGVIGECRAYKVSYNRPFHTRSFEPETWVFGEEYPMVFWLESNGYDVTYSTATDTDRGGSLLLNHKVWMSNGHDEYWSGTQRANVEAAVTAGVNLAFFSSNTLYWKTRWENSIDGAGVPFRTLVCYKETWANASIDPATPATWTGTWRDPRFSPPKDGNRPENALMGTLSRIVGGYSGAITVPQADGKMRFWRNTSVARLASGQVYTLPEKSLAREIQADEDNGYRPAGVFHLSTTTATSPDNFLLDYGTTVGGGTMTHALTLYRHTSGALVFSAGTYDWSLGLAVDPTDVNMQQATINLFADMGVQPKTLQSGLVSATASSDHTPPHSVTVTPASGSSLNVGVSVLVTGTAADSGGGVVGAVEVSTDGGSTWHPAKGRENWTYTFTPTLAGSINIKSRAVDDSGNLETPASGNFVTVNGTSIWTIWPLTVSPGLVDAGPDSSLEVGVKFRADSNGFVTGIRFYKASTNTGTHTGSLWTSTGTLLATATFVKETASGWQQVSFSTPVAVTANTVYVASYHTSVGHYSGDLNYFIGNGIDNVPLHALGTNINGSNGVFAYGTSTVYPDTSYAGTNYWVDVVYTTTTPQPPPLSSIVVSPAGQSIFSGATQQFIATGIYTNNSSQDISSVVTWASSNTTVATIGSSGFATGASPGSSTISATLNGVTGSTNLSVVPAAPVTSIWSSSTVPGTLDAGADSPVELGVKFRSDLSGYITGVRFYKAGTNTGAHVANLWTSSGTLLATATFTNETASGWQQVSFPTPVAITLNTVYVVSYHTNVGHYSYTSAYFSGKGADNSQLHALASGVSGVNGVYAYGATSSFPTNGYNASNYWVDVVYATTAPPPPAPAITTSSLPGGVVTAAYSATLSGSGGTTPYTWSISVGVLPAGLILNTATGTITGTPTVAGTSNFTVQLTDAGAPARTATKAMSITVATAISATLWSSSTVPAVVDAGPDSSVELGVRFRSDAAGHVVGVRFYKATANTGSHTASLWTSTGSLLASATFANETASGWQQVNFTSPVAIAANTVYVVSYHVSAGHYSYSSAYFAGSGVDNPPLHALADGVSGSNGLYAYGSASSFPSNGYNASNYWVDVVFTQP